MDLQTYAAQKRHLGRPIAPYIDQDAGELPGVTRASAIGGAVTTLVEALFANPKAVAREFRGQAKAETFGAAFIESAAKVCSDQGLRAELDSHALDEYRHGRMFRALAERLGENFPASAEQPNEAVFRKEDPGAFTGKMGPFICSTHVAEIRSLFLLGAYLEAASLLPETLRPRIVSSLKRIHEDEVRHAEYSGRWVQHYLTVSELPESYISECFAAFEQNVWRTLSQIATHLRHGWTERTHDTAELPEALGARSLVTRILAEANVQTSNAFDVVLSAVEQNHPARAIAAYEAVESCLLADEDAHAASLFADGDEERCAVGLIRTLRKHLPDLTAAEIKALHRHEADEVRHAHMYDSYASRLRGDRGVTGREIDNINPFDDLGPDFRPEHAGQLLLSLHLGEVHNLQRIRQRLAALKAGEADYPWLVAGLETIASDEVRHIVSTGALLDRLMADQPGLRKSIETYARQYGGTWWSDIAMMATALSGNPKTRYSA